MNVKMWVNHPRHFVMTSIVKFSVTFYSKLLEPQSNTNRNNTYKLSLSYMLSISNSSDLYNITMISFYSCTYVNTQVCLSVIPATSFAWNEPSAPNILLITLMTIFYPAAHGSLPRSHQY
jgi:hypothetical protein